jgi:hypothetical protein
MAECSFMKTCPSGTERKSLFGKSERCKAGNFCKIEKMFAGKKGTAMKLSRRNQRRYCMRADKHFRNKCFMPVMIPMKMEIKILHIKKWIPKSNK